MSSHTGVPPNPNRYTGLSTDVVSCVTRKREPTGADFRQPETGANYPFNCFWLVGKNPTTGTFGDLWVLTKIVANVAYWVRLTAGGFGTTISVDVPLGSSPVIPTVAGLLTFTSSGGTVDITGSLNTINFDLSGGGVGIDSFHPNSGTDPVVPDANGLVNITGAGSTTTIGSLNTISVELFNVDQYSIQSGGASTNLLNNIPPSATTGIPLVSQGNAAQPIFGTAVVAGGGTGQTTLTQYSVLVGDGTNPVTSITNGTTGQVLTAVTGGNPIWTSPGANFSVVTQVFTSNGTYTPTTNMKYCIIEVVGGGGGSGGRATTPAGEGSAAGGGGAGGYARGTFSAATIGVSKAVTVGAAGAAGTAGANNGGTGGTTSVDVLLTATGGTGGTGATSVATASYASFSGGSGGSGTGGDFQATGGAGGSAMNIAFQLNIGGFGGNSFFGGGGLGSDGSDGVAGTSYGGGGSGPAKGENTTQQAGKAGGAGIVIVTEYVFV